MAEKTGAGQDNTDTDATKIAAAAATKATADAAAAAAAAAATGTGGTQTETGGKAVVAAPTPKAPEKYVLTVPKNAEVYLDKGDLEAISAIAKANDWSNEEAQARLEQHAENLATQSAAFREQTVADLTYGGDHLEETQRLAQHVIDRVRPEGHARREAFNRLLAKTGYGNHLEVVSFLADLGKLMAEDKPPGGAGASKGPKKTVEEMLYPEKEKS